jgi:hypothetical protein
MGQIMAHPAAADEGIQWFQRVMQECAARAAGVHSMELEEETEEPAFVWPETLDELL